jgi:hypothetical protein
MLRRMPGKNRVLIAIVVLAALALAGYWGYAEQQKGAQQAAVAAALTDTTTRLRDSLAVAPNATGKPALARIEGHAAAVEAHLKTVRGAKSVPELADSAEHYVLGAREILRRQAASIRQSEQSAASRAALIAHMRRAARRDGAWIRDAMAQKKTVEAQYFDYGLTLKALAELLGTFPDSKTRLAPHVAGQALLDDAPAAEARTLVHKESRRVADELASVRRLAPR